MLPIIKDLQGFMSIFCNIYFPALSAKISGYDISNFGFILHYENTNDNPPYVVNQPIYTYSTSPVLSMPSTNHRCVNKYNISNGMIIKKPVAIFIESWNTLGPPTSASKFN